MSRFLTDAIRRITELERRQSNMLRVGTIAEADYARARVRVSIGPLLTAWLPWLTQRASKTSTWHAPEVGEQVLVVSPAGELAQAVVIPALYQSAHPANADNPDIARITFADGAVLEYDRAAHRLAADIPGSASIKTSGDLTAAIGGKLAAEVTGSVSLDTKAAADIKAAAAVTVQSVAAVTITAPVITLNGVTTINGPLTQGTGSAGGGATMAGPLKVDADVTAGGVSLKSHVHGGVDPGPSSTGVPI